ncbi:MAG: hypothetical protein IT162_15340 [Bryobacterales bacterium]|nr:hypothetical protein [Bryobacterales bacterium]
MLIGSSQISYGTSHRSASAAAVTEEAIVRPRPVASRPRPAPPRLDTVDLSAAAASCDCREDLRGLDPKQRAAALAVEAIAGRRIRWVNFSPGSAAPPAARPAPVAASMPSAPTATRRTEYYAESEQTNFTAQGLVETADGRQIRFNIDLTMSREYESVTTRIIEPPPPPPDRGPNVKDPLVLNFNNAPARLTEAKIAFDLDADGETEQISFAAEGSGFLTLDRNGDGRATNGAELFGPQTGNGFAELAAYDEDRNGWIDEADSVYSRLRVWDQAGYATLAEKGVGAIAVNAAETPFAYRDANNTLHAQLRSTGVYLQESGEAGTIQQLDLVVS